MKKVIAYFLIILLCVTICTSCNKSKNETLITYKGFYDDDIVTFNYLTTNIHSDYSHIANFVDGLIENDKYGNIVPSIAKSWKSETIGNKQVWTFYLRENVYWSDYKGNKYDLVTAHDFVTTIKYVLNYNIGSNNYSLPASLLENGINYYNATLIQNYNYDEVVSKINELERNDPNNELSLYKKVKETFDFCMSNTCNNDFDTVGIKAINDYELQFTLSNPVPYFLSALTYCPFLPVNERFIKEVGFNNFGTNKKYLLYCGAYLLKNYYHSSKIEYIKNNNYWDIEKVYIDKIIFNRLLNYPGSNYTRLAYENGDIDDFYVNEGDTKGWTKYVTGENGKGSVSSPAGNNTYVIDQVTDFTTYYLVFNQNRTSNKLSTLTMHEIEVSNLALSNTNFRKSLIYGLTKSSYSGSPLNAIISSIIPKTFVYVGDKDYTNYFIEEYAANNNMTIADASNILESDDASFDLNNSSYFLSLALKELNLPASDLPIKLEFSYYYSQDYTKYDLSRINEWNNLLNGCDIDDSICDYDKVLITYNSALTNHVDFVYAAQDGEYGISVIGVYPNFIDPTTYLESFSSTGELYPFLNHNESATIQNALENIRNYYKEEELDTRFRLCAELEYSIIYDLGLVLPLYMNNSTNRIIVSNLVPYQKMKASYGLSPFKFKLRKKREKNYTQEDILKLKQEYEEGRNAQ